MTVHDIYFSNCILFLLFFCFLFFVFCFLFFVFCFVSFCFILFHFVFVFVFVSYHNKVFQLSNLNHETV